MSRIVRTMIALGALVTALSTAGPLTAAGASMCTINPDACMKHPPPSGPTAASNLAVSNVTSSSATLSWQDNATDEDSYVIIRWKFVAPGQPAASTVVLPAHPGTGPMSWTDINLDPFTLYQWGVAAARNGSWAREPWASAWTSLSPAIPAGDHVAAFLNDHQNSVFPQIDKTWLIADLVNIVRNPDVSVDQGTGTGGCGPAAIEFELARRNPAQLVDAVRSIYETGSFSSRATTYNASPELRNSPAHADVGLANWLFLATLRDSANPSSRITAATDPNSVAWITYPSEESGWLDQILGLGNIWAPAQSPFETMGTDMNRSQYAFNAGGAVILLIDSSLVGNPPGVINVPNHYVSVRNWSPNSPYDTFTVKTWDRVQTLTVPYQDFNAKTFQIFMAWPS